MSDRILDMWLNQNPDDLVDDEQFLHATYRVGLQMEKRKALRKAKEAIRAGVSEESALKEMKKVGQSKRSSDNTQRTKETKRNPPPKQGSYFEKNRNWYVGKEARASKEEALVTLTRFGKVASLIFALKQ